MMIRFIRTYFLRLCMTINTIIIIIKMVTLLKWRWFLPLVMSISFTQCGNRTTEFMDRILSKPTFGRDRRQADEVKVYRIELLVVVDVSVFKFWYESTIKETNGTERTVSAENMIRHHYAQLVNGINVRFSNLDTPNFALAVSISDMIILKHSDECIWVAPYYSGVNLSATRALAYFRKWLRLSSGLPPHDHAMLFTRYNLIKDGSDTIAGLAYVGTMCTSTSVSVVEDTGTSQVSTVAVHELSHSMGAQHDGTTNRCSDQENYIMSDTTTITGNLDRNRNSWKFSPCTENYFRQYIASLDRVGNNCLETQDAYFDFGLRFLATTDNNRSDIVPTPDDQCRLAENSSSFICRNLYSDNYTDFCALLFCRVEETICSFKLPHDWTPCGYRKVCQSGFCRYLGDEADIHGDTISDSCPFGDQPGELMSTGLTCEASIQGKPFLCYQKYFSSRCCRSCELAYTAVAECEYGDKEEKCSTANWFDCLLDDSACCITCSQYATSGLILPVSLGAVGLVCLVIVGVVCWKTRRGNAKRKDPTPRQENSTAPSQSIPTHMRRPVDSIANSTRTGTYDRSASRGFQHSDYLSHQRHHQSFLPHNALFVRPEMWGEMSKLAGLDKLGVHVDPRQMRSGPIYVSPEFIRTTSPSGYSRHEPLAISSHSSSNTDHPKY